MIQEQQLIANEIDKYFRLHRIDASWISSHLKPAIVMPSDGFEPQSLSEVSIRSHSIKNIGNEIYEFSGNAKAVFADSRSQIKSKGSVEFGGNAIFTMIDGRLVATELILTRFHSISDK